MTNPMTPEQRKAIAHQLGDVKPATDGLLGSVAESVANIRHHEHPAWEDLYCMNLTSYMGERVAPILRRLLDVEAEVARLDAEGARLYGDLTGANLGEWEEEQDNARLRLALASAQRGRREMRARVTELEALTPARFQDCQQCGAGYEYGKPCALCEFKARMAAEHTVPANGEVAYLDAAQSLLWNREAQEPSAPLTSRARLVAHLVHESAADQDELESRVEEVIAAELVEDAQQLEADHPAAGPIPAEVLADVVAGVIRDYDRDTWDATGNQVEALRRALFEYRDRAEGPASGSLLGRLSEPGVEKALLDWIMRDDEEPTGPRSDESYPG